MGKGTPIDHILEPLDAAPTQYFLGTGLHTLGLLRWILNQTGKARVIVSTFSTSDAFLSGFLRLRREGMIDHAEMLVDLKASRKIVKLNDLMKNCFEKIHLSMNHSKVVLVGNDSQRVTVITSQNQTYGDRAECTMVTTSPEAYETFLYEFLQIIEKKSITIDGVHQRDARTDRELRLRNDDGFGDFEPIGV